jgi:hypothetical protein
VAVPYLLVHVDAPSAMLQFDVLRALSGSRRTEPGVPKTSIPRTWLRGAWVVEAPREGTRRRREVVALSGLAIATNYLAWAELTSKPAATSGDESPEPVAHLLGCVEWLTGYTVPRYRSESPDSAFGRGHYVAVAIRHFQGLGDPRRRMNRGPATSSLGRCRAVTLRGSGADPSHARRPIGSWSRMQRGGSGRAIEPVPSSRQHLTEELGG